MISPKAIYHWSVTNREPNDRVLFADLGLPSKPGTSQWSSPPSSWPQRIHQHLSSCKLLQLSSPAHLSDKSHHIQLSTASSMQNINLSQAVRKSLGHLSCWRSTTFLTHLPRTVWKWWTRYSLGKKCKVRAWARVGSFCRWTGYDIVWRFNLHYWSHPRMIWVTF